MDRPERAPGPSGSAGTGEPNSMEVPHFAPVNNRFDARDPPPGGNPPLQAPQNNVRTRVNFGIGGYRRAMAQQKARDKALNVEDIADVVLPEQLERLLPPKPEGAARATRKTVKAMKASPKSYGAKKRVPAQKRLKRRQKKVSK